MVEKFKFGAFVIIIFVCLLLAFKKGKQKQDIVLLIWCFIFGIHLITINYQAQLPSTWFYLNEVLSYLHGFILFCIIGLSTKQEFPLRRFLTHILPLTIVSGLALLILQDSYWKYPFVIIITKAIVTLSYIVAAYLKFRHKKLPHLNWYLFLTLGVIVLTILPLLSALFNYDKFILDQNLIGNIAYCVFIIMLGFFGIGIEPVFVNEYKVPNEAPIPKYSLSTLSEMKRQEIFKSLEKLVEEEQLYTYTDLSVGILSNRIGHNSSRLSESINQVAGCNFNDYINEKRIAAFKKMIENGDHKQKTILSLAFDCGFNSKTSFNRAFKKQMNCTPSHFISTTS